MYLFSIPFQKDSRLNQIWTAGTVAANYTVGPISLLTPNVCFVRFNLENGGPEADNLGMRSKVHRLLSYFSSTFITF